MRKTEDHHHTVEQLADYINAAQKLCGEWEITDDERVHLLPVLVTLLSSKQVFYEQVGPLPDLSAIRRR